MDLYYKASSAPCRSVLMAAKTMGIELNLKAMDLRAGDQMKPEYLKLNPQHCVPTLVDNDFVLWESRAILVYLAEKYAKDTAFYPKCAQKRAIINQRLYFDMGTFYKSFVDYYYPQMLKKVPADPEMFQKIESAFDMLNTFLEGQNYVAGDELSVADIALLASVTTFDVSKFDFSKYANVARWYENAKKVVAGYAENYDVCVARVKACTQ